MRNSMPAYRSKANIKTAVYERQLIAEAVEELINDSSVYVRL